MTTSHKGVRAASIVTSIGLIAVLVSGCRSEAQADSDSGSTVPSPGITDTTISLGITAPLSGAAAGQGTCVVAGVRAYFGGVNAEGGVEFGDGKTRTIEINALDDAYDPQMAVANFQQLQDEVFAMTAGPGTPTNRAYREAAIADEVPQALVLTGDPIFSDTEQSPWQLGFVPVFENEGEAFGKLLADSGEKHTVAILAQNDDYGEGYVAGLKKGIDGASNITIVKELTYEVTDTSVDAQLTELASTDADIFFNAMAIVPLAVTSLQKAQELGWKPSWFLPSTTSSPGAVLTPGGASAFPAVYTTAYAKTPSSPEYATDEDVTKFLADLKEYANFPEIPVFPTCAWGYMVGATLERAFEETTEPTRENFMGALRSIDDFQAPLMLPGTVVDTTVDGQPAVATVVVQKYNGQGFDSVTSLD